MQIRPDQGKNNIKTSIWKLCVILFFMALVSIYSSFSMDKKVIQKHKNNKKLEELKSTFVANQKRVNDLRKEIISQAKEQSFGFVEPKKEDVIIVEQ